MKSKTIGAILAGALLAGALVAPAGTASAKGKSGPVVVATDEAGDWGAATEPALAPLGDALGQDLVEASIELPDPKTVNFIVKVNSLLPAGGTPEFTRYTWDFTVDKGIFNLDGKFTNYSRGACDPLSAACPPPRDPGLYPFQLKGNCTVQSTGANVTTCEEIAVVAATFDAAAGTITIPVPTDLLKIKPGSKINGVNNGLFGGVIEAFPSAYLSSNSFPYDNIAVVDEFVVPGGKTKRKK